VLFAPQFAAGQPAAQFAAFPPGVAQFAAMPAAMMAAPQLAAPALAPAAAQYSRYRYPTPDKFSGSTTDRIHDVEVWFKDVERFASKSGVSIREALCDLTVGDARVQVDTMIKDPAFAHLTDPQFGAHFIAHYTALEKPRHLAARDKLFDNAARMADGELVNAYNSRFSRLALDAQPIADADLICHYQRGLTPELAELCQVPDGLATAFTTIHELYAHATKAEARLRGKRARLSAALVIDSPMSLAAAQVQQPALANAGPGAPGGAGGFVRGSGGGGPMYQRRGQQGHGFRRQGGRPRRDYGGPRDGRGYGRRNGGRPPRDDGWQQVGPAQRGQGPRQQLPRTSGRDDHAQARYQFARKTGACGICLQQGHFAAACPQRDMGGMA
jgi:hypothetical protein